MRRLTLLLLLGVMGLAVIAGTAHAARPGPSIPKPREPGNGWQVGAVSDVSSVNRAEMQLAHSCPIAVPAPGEAYSYSLVGITESNFTVRMGYIVLGSDGASATCYNTPDQGSQCCSGWARWFVQVLNPSGEEVYWKISRAGEANPPPASSCSSGDGTCNGYPFSFGRTGPDTWTFWFDWISKAKVRIPGSGNALQKIYFLGEVSDAGGVMGPRTALTTYRVTGGSTWLEPEVASSFYSGLSCTDGYGVHSPNEGPPRNNGTAYWSTEAGSGVTCVEGDLWTTTASP